MKRNIGIYVQLIHFAAYKKLTLYIDNIVYQLYINKKFLKNLCSYNNIKYI